VKDTKARVYVAGPYSSGIPDDNIRAATNAADELWGHGFIPFVPHWNLFWGILHPKGHSEWLVWCKAWLRECEYLLRLPGHSKGADEEETFARGLGITVCYRVREVIDHWEAERHVHA